MDTITPPPLPEILQIPAIFSSDELRNGLTPEGVYESTVNTHNHYLIVIRKHIGEKIKLKDINLTVDESTVTLLTYYPDTGQIHPAIPISNYNWKYLPNCKVVFNLTDT